MTFLVLASGAPLPGFWSVVANTAVPLPSQPAALGILDLSQSLLDLPFPGRSWGLLLDMWSQMLLSPFHLVSFLLGPLWPLIIKKKNSYSFFTIKVTILTFVFISFSSKSTLLPFILLPRGINLSMAQSNRVCNLPSWDRVSSMEAVGTMGRR